MEELFTNLGYLVVSTLDNTGNNWIFGPNNSPNIEELLPGPKKYELKQTNRRISFNLKSMKIRANTSY